MLDLQELHDGTRCVNGTDRITNKGRTRSETCSRYALCVLQPIADRAGDEVAAGPAVGWCLYSAIGVPSIDDIDAASDVDSCAVIRGAHCTAPRSLEARPSETSSISQRALAKCRDPRGSPDDASPRVLRRIRYDAARPMLVSELE